MRQIKLEDHKRRQTLTESAKGRLIESLRERKLKRAIYIFYLAIDRECKCKLIGTKP